MKKLLLVAILALAFICPVDAATLNVADFGYAQDIASSSTTLTLKTAVASQYITLYGLTVAMDADDYFYVTCGGTQKTGRKWIAANSGISQVYYPLKVECGANEALAIVRGAAATKTSADFWYLQEPR